MAKKNRKRRLGLMSNSSIPYARRLRIHKQQEIVTCRDHAARIAMYCVCAALHDLEGIAYQRLIRFAVHHKTLVNEYDYELQTHALQAVQVALYLGTIAANDVFGFGPERQRRLGDRVRYYSSRYGKEGSGFLLEKMKKIGFTVANGVALAFVDEEGKAVKPSKVEYA